MRGLFTLRLIRRAFVLFVLCCLSGVCSAQSAETSQTQVYLRVMLEGALSTPDTVTEEPGHSSLLRIIKPSQGTAFNLLRIGKEAATTQVQVVIEASNTEASVAMELQTDSGGEAVVSTTKSSISFARNNEETQRTAEFVLTSVGAGNTTVAIIVADGNNRDEVRIRVRVVLGCKNCLVPEMVEVPSGNFTMGSPENELGRYNSEGPQRDVAIDAFEVGKYEVTRGQFAVFAEETGNAAGHCWRNPGFEQSDDHPVVCVSWEDVQAYLSWLSAGSGQRYRLLSEAEWEYVARAGTTTAYHFGAEITPQQANYNSTGTVAVGSYAANDFGLHDVHGNVWEWVEDCWHDNYNGAPSDGSAWTSNCKHRFSHVLRGGSWRKGLLDLGLVNNPRDLRSASRATTYSGRRINVSGFRIARTLNP